MSDIPISKSNAYSLLEYKYATVRCGRKRRRRECELFGGAYVIMRVNTIHGGRVISTKSVEDYLMEFM